MNTVFNRFVTVVTLLLAEETITKLRIYIYIHISSLNLYVTRNGLKHVCGVCQCYFCNLRLKCVRIFYVGLYLYHIFDKKCTKNISIFCSKCKNRKKIMSNGGIIIEFNSKMPSILKSCQEKKDFSTFQHWFKTLALPCKLFKSQNVLISDFIFKIISIIESFYRSK